MQWSCVKFPLEQNGVEINKAIFIFLLLELDFQEFTIMQKVTNFRVSFTFRNTLYSLPSFPQQVTT